MTFTHALATNRYGEADLIVSSDPSQGTHTTLTSAMAAAVSGQTIFLRTSVTESVTITPGVNIAAWVGGLANTPSITGTITMTAAGSSSISGIRLVTNSAALIAVTGSAASVLRLYNCYLDMTNNTGITFSSSNAGAAIGIYNCNGNLGTTGIGIYTHTSAGTLSFQNTNIDNGGGSSTASTNSAGVVGFTGCAITSPLSVSSAATLTLTNSFINSGAQNATCITTANTAAVSIYTSQFLSGSASAISIGAGSIVNIYNDVQISSTNTNAITGAGTVQYGLIHINAGFSSGMNVTTQVPFVALGGGWSLITTLTASASATLDFTTLPIYPCYVFVLKNVLLATNAQQLLMRISNDNGSTFAATGYTAGANYTSYNTAVVLNVNATTSIPLTSAASNGVGVSGTIYFTPQNATVWGMSSYLSTTSAVAAFATLGGEGNIVANAFRFLSSSGNLTSGTITLYGLIATV